MSTLGRTKWPYFVNRVRTPTQCACGRPVVLLYTSLNNRVAHSDRKPRAAAQHKRHLHNSKDKRPNEYELRVGYAIAILQDELPNFFAHGLTEHSIYSQRIVLSDPHYTRISMHGRTAYLGIAEALRWSLRFYFDDILFEITRMRVLPDSYDVKDDDMDSPSSSFDRTALRNDHEQKKETVRHLEVRWRLEGTRHPSFLLPGLVRPVQHYEGVFLYTFDHEGLIGEHRIQRIVPPPSRRILLIHSWGGRIRAYWEEMKRRRVPELSPGVGCITKSNP